MTAPYSQEQLEALLADLESDLVERKASLQGDAPGKIREAVCAFANDLPDHRRPGVQRYGFGIPAARRELRSSGQGEPRFRVEPTRVCCTVRART